MGNAELVDASKDVVAKSRNVRVILLEGIKMRLNE